MLVTTTSNLEGCRIVRYLGLVSGEAIFGINIAKDLFVGNRDIVGGRSNTYESVGGNGSMLMVAVSGTAIVYEDQ